MSQNQSKTSSQSPDPEKTSPRMKMVIEWTRSIVIAVGLAMLIRWPVAEPFQIPSGSMEPTFQNGDRIFVDKHVYGVRYPFNGFRIPFTRNTIWYSDGRLWRGAEPQRWDIVVFKSVESKVEHDTLVKRIVGLPGEHIHIRGGKIYINGEAVELAPGMPPIEYTFEPMSNMYGLRTDDEHARIPEDHYFLMGDNSAHSRDGRWFGFVPNHHILGRVSSIWWPVSRWRDLTGFSDSMWWIGTWASLVLLTVSRLFLGRSWALGHSLGNGLFKKGDHVLVRFSMGIPIPFSRRRVGAGQALAHGDLVLYRPKEGLPEDTEALVGMVGGLPGDRVFLDGGTLRIDDVSVDEGSALATLRFPTGGERGRYGASKGREYSQVPEGHYFLLTDDTVPDSRTLGWIPHENITGTVRGVWWPLRRWRRAAKRE